jgi:UDP-3-O-[3-hydroxymyristoyl] glucosamine N-acyltransferase
MTSVIGRNASLVRHPPMWLPPTKLFSSTPGQAHSIVSSIGNRSRIAPTAVIHRKKNLRLGRNVTIMDFAVIGLSNYYQDIFENEHQKLIQIGDRCRIYPWALIYEGATLETGVVMEERTTVGSLTTVGANTRIVYQAQVNDNVAIGKDCVIGGFVADNFPARRP